jgi:hypothetical protein
MDEVFIASFVSAYYSHGKHSNDRHGNSASYIAPVFQGPYRTRAHALRAIKRMKFRLQKRGQTVFEATRVSPRDQWSDGSMWDEVAIIISAEKFVAVVREEAKKIKTWR